MKTFRHGGVLIESVEELPNLHYHSLFLDFETTSGSPDLDSLNPWHHCGILGACITGDRDPTSYYIPARYLDKNWLSVLLSNSNRWINHNIIYDYLVLHNNLNIQYQGRLIDTLALAKLVDTDLTYKGGYQLSALSSTWLKEGIQHYEEAFSEHLRDSKDYGDVPEYLMGNYGCMDVITNRKVWDYIFNALGDDQQELVKTEISLTKVLAEMSVRGLRVDLMEIKKASLLSLETMRREWDEILALAKVPEDQVDKPSPNSPKDLESILRNRYDLPKLKLTDTGNTSFDKYALQEYDDWLTINPEHGGGAEAKKMLGHLMKYKKASTMQTLFWEPWQHLQVDSILHPAFNQSVRSGRMSCRQPNAQQINTEAKGQIFPRDGFKFYALDYSQAEFKIMACVIKSERIIEQYRNDPGTDYHQLIADMVGIDRQSAKTLNFAIGFGGGKKLVVSMLRKFGSESSAEKTYKDYHDMLPELRVVSRHTTRVATQRGYVFNSYGRHLHLPPEFAHLSFNRIVQSNAADALKERLVALDRVCKSLGCYIVCTVHDSVLIEAPLAADYGGQLRECFCDLGDRFAIPMTADLTESEISWGCC